MEVRESVFFNKIVVEFFSYLEVEISRVLYDEFHFVIRSMLLSAHFYAVSVFFFLQNI